MKPRTVDFKDILLNRFDHKKVLTTLRLAAVFVRIITCFKFIKLVT